MDVMSTLASDSAFTRGVTAWLETTMTMPMLHWGVIMSSTTGAASMGVSLSIPVAQAVSFISHNAGSGAMGVASSLMPDLVSPNIEGIPISSPSIRMSRESEVSEVPVIIQKAGQKEYKTDNAVPRLAEWHIDGYITSLSDINRQYNKPSLNGMTGLVGMAFGGLDKGLTIKPTLIIQKQYLDACQLSRRPVWFKTNECQFKLVQITSAVYEQTVETGNAIHVSLSVKEFNPYIIKDISSDQLSAQEVKYDDRGFSLNV